MRNHLLLFLLVCFANVSAQDITFKLQRSLEFEDSHKNSAIVLSKDDGKGGFYVVRSYKNGGISFGEGFYFEHFDADMNVKKDFEFEIKTSNAHKFNYILGVAALGNDIQIVDLYYDMAGKAFVCRAHIIDPDLNVTQKELFRLPRETVQEIGGLQLEARFYQQSDKIWTFSDAGDIVTAVSLTQYSANHGFVPVKKNDQKQVTTNLAMAVNASNNAFAIALDLNGKTAEYLKLYLFDTSLNKVIDTQFTRQNDAGNAYQFHNIQVSDEGDAIYLLGKAFSKNLKKKEEGGKYAFELSRITASEQKSQTIETGEHFIGTLKTVCKNNQLLCLGFYSDYNDSKFKGVSYFKFDRQTLDPIKTTYSPFTEQFMLDKYGKLKDKPVRYLVFKNLFFTNNNDLIFNAEEQSIKVTGSVMANGISTGGNTYYNYDDIVTARLNAEGAIVWIRNINKDQSTADDDNSYLSYTSMVRGETNYFFINAGEKIRKLRNDRIEFNQVRNNKSNLNVIRVDPNGDFDYKEILDDENSAVPFMVAKGILTADAVMFLGRKGKTKQLLKVTL